MSEGKHKTLFWTWRWRNGNSLMKIDLKDVDMYPSESESLMAFEHLNLDDEPFKTRKSIQKGYSIK